MRPLLAVVSFSVAALLVSDAVAQTVPANMVALQAEVETVYNLSDGTQVRNHGYFYRSRSGQIREDSSLGAVITDVAAGTITILIAETKEARVITIPPEQKERPVRSTRSGPEVFEETTVGGHRVSKATGRGPQGQTVEFWTAKDLGVVTWTKTEAAGLTTTKELRNISTREPSPALFAIPADYTVIEQEARPGNGPQRVLPGQRGPVSPPVR
jgi:hypothetical protein